MMRKIFGKNQNTMPSEVRTPKSEQKMRKHVLIVNNKGRSGFPFCVQNQGGL
jgi:hypothetical protein